MKNLDYIASDLFNKIRGRFDNVTIGNEKGEVTNVPEEARFFDFSFKESGMSLGKVSVALDEENGVTVIVGRDIVQNQMEDVQDRWFNFLKELRIFAKKRTLSFDVRDINKSNLDKRDYKFLATNRPGENKMAESKLYGTKNTTFQRIGSAKIAIKHSAPIGEGETRLKNIKGIFIETPEGERIKYPVKHLQGARALALHVSEGGHPYDDFGKYITGLSEELASLGKFKTYMKRKSVMAEALQDYVSVVESRVKEVRKEISNLQKPSFYTEAVSNYVALVVEDVPEDVAENWVDQLTIKQFNEELKDVFPYIYKLVGEATRATKLGPNELVAEADDPCWKNYKQIGMKKKGGKQVPNCVPEEEQLEAAFEKAMGQFSEGMDPKAVMGQIRKMAKGVETSPDEREHRIFASQVESDLIDLFQYYNQVDRNTEKQEIVRNLIRQNKKAQQETDRRNANNIVTVLWDLMNANEGNAFANAVRQAKMNGKKKGDKVQGPDGDEITLEKEKTPLGEFILSYFDRENGTFPKGETAVLTMVEKDYGPQYVESAAQFMHKVQGVVEQRKAEEAATSRYPETEMIKQLAGVR